MTISREELVDVAIAKGLVSRDTVDHLRVEARQRRLRLVDLVASHARFPLSTLYHAVAEHRGMPFVDLGARPPLESLARRIPEAVLRTRPVVPVAEEDGCVLVATADPDDTPTLDKVARILERPLRVALTDPEALQDAARSILANRPNGHATPLGNGSLELDAVAALERILNQAYLRRASDVHIESMPDGIRVRMRVDGRLQTFAERINSETASSIISRLKVLAGLDIAEQRMPQDGRFTFQPVGREELDINTRVATIPTRWGERMTLRLMDGAQEQLSLADLGMSEADMASFRETIRRPHGIILITGPTGSGKTTTLYGALREIDQSQLNIMTVEDPIECVIPGISQVHIDGSEKITFASALKSLVRHDPDVLMVGEIRDYETADIALKAALTGHLVFSTLHTNSACGAVTRLVDMGCQPYLVGSTLTAVIAQRLVRRLCNQCKVSRLSTPAEASLLGREGHDVTVYEPGGCARCLETGYFGRIGIFETLWIDADLRALISRGASEADVADHAGSSLRTLRADAVLKVLAGATSLEEILSATVAEV